MNVAVGSLITLVSHSHAVARLSWFGNNTAMNRWRTLLTEGRHPASETLDTMTSEEVVALLLEEDKHGLDRALDEKANIARAATWVAETLESGGSVVFAGAGTSGRLGVLEAAECPPTFGSDPERIRALIAGGDDAVFRAKEGAEDREDEGRKAATDLDLRDLLIGLSASSVTRYVLGALNQAREQGARTILLTCAAGEGLEEAADLVITTDDYVVMADCLKGREQHDFDTLFNCKGLVELSADRKNFAKHTSL